MKLKAKSEKMYQIKLEQLYGITFWMCTLYCLIISVFSKTIVLLLYGSKYLEAAKVLPVVVWYSTFSYFGSINNIYLVAENKTKYSQYITLSGAIINIVLNLLLIPKFKIIGAAVASLLTQFLINFALLYLVPSLREAFRLLIRGITLKNINIKSVWQDVTRIFHRDQKEKK